MHLKGVRSTSKSRPSTGTSTLGAGIPGLKIYFEIKATIPGPLASTGTATYPLFTWMRVVGGGGGGGGFFLGGGDRSVAGVEKRIDSTLFGPQMYSAMIFTFWPTICRRIRSQMSCSDLLPVTNSRSRCTGTPRTFDLDFTQVLTHFLTASSN